jgi:DNA-binding LacI/PurR family transcriptional regulator
LDRIGNGTRKPTLVDVAKAAGVSRALVSIIVRGAPGASDETRARVLAMAEELGYRPDTRARLLARSASRLLGVTYKVGSLHHADLLSPIYETAEAAGYEVILSGQTHQHDEHRAINVLLGYRCDAMLMISPDMTEAELQRLATTMPVLSLGRRMLHGAGGVDVVRTDEDTGIRLAVEHLVGLGHRRIAHVDGGHRTIASDRRRPYREHMTRLGLRDEIHVVTGGDDGESGRRGARALFAGDRLPTAVIVYNDESAWGVMRTLADHGLAVPQDVSVVGYDGSAVARMAPHELTTIRQDVAGLGHRAVERLIARLEQDVPVGDLVLVPTFAPGETTGPAPATHDD